jgi:hypothetical protein
MLKPYNPPNGSPQATIKGPFGNLNVWNLHGDGIPNLGPKGDPVNNTNLENPNDGYWINL